MPGQSNPVLSGKGAGNASQDLRALDSNSEKHTAGSQTEILAAILLMETPSQLICLAL